MKNIIAIIWDFDKTLIDGYMQDPIFEDYNVDAHKFWTEVNALPKKYETEQHVKVNPDTIYINQFIKCIIPKSPFMNRLNDEYLYYFEVHYF